VIYGKLNLYFKVRGARPGTRQKFGSGNNVSAASLATRSCKPAWTGMFHPAQRGTTAGSISVDNSYDVWFNIARQ